MATTLGNAGERAGTVSSDTQTQLADDGYCILPDVLTANEAADALDALHRAAEAARTRGHATFMPALDPNASNVRVFYLLALDPIFRALIRHSRAIDIVERLLGPDFMISNFTANIALPGSGSMALHSDQGIVVPGPWLQPWTVNIIWCLTDCHTDNGATLFIPGSHRWTSRDDIPADAIDRLRPFEAKAGSIIAMDGRVWHTSGANVTENEERALLFGYYTKPFLRPQVNWNALLSADLQAEADPWMRQKLGLDVTANTTGANDLATYLDGSQAEAAP
ncbi:phytanoyl-CoA dioxygenase family protein [Novosphingobium sp. ZN18A2]|uniref:phytanoyl-CoA dioxygenase family protein n=1 Tax=Novosphingobium sp. ZN18A2 TaxID=3079861 RepID=UPI0030CE8EE2